MYIGNHIVSQRHGATASYRGVHGTGTRKRRLRRIAAAPLSACAVPVCWWARRDHSSHGHGTVSYRLDLGFGACCYLVLTFLLCPLFHLDLDHFHTPPSSMHLDRPEIWKYIVLFRMSEQHNVYGLVSPQVSLSLVTVVAITLQSIRVV